MAPLKLGVELELKVANNPNAPCGWDSPYKVYVSWPKGKPIGKHHPINGNLAQKIWELSDGQIQVGYDYTVSDKASWAGFEMTSGPGGLEENRALWRKLYNDPMFLQSFTNVTEGVTSSGNPKQCGMHIHASPTEPKMLMKLIKFINTVSNGTLIAKVAGRYNDHYCSLLTMPTLSKVQTLYHSPDCLHKGKIDVGYEYVEEDVEEEMDVWDLEACCPNFEAHQYNLADHDTWVNSKKKRTGLNVIPCAGTGDIEFRLFQSPITWTGFETRLEFAHAAIRYAESDAKNLKEYVTANASQHAALAQKLKWS